MALTWPEVLPLAPAGPAVSMAELHVWMRKYSPATTLIEPTPGTDGHSCGELIKLLKDKGCVGRLCSAKPFSNFLDSMPLRVGGYQESPGLR